MEPYGHRDRQKRVPMKERLRRYNCSSTIWSLATTSWPLSACGVTAPPRRLRFEGGTPGLPLVASFGSNGSQPVAAPRAVTATVGTTATSERSAMLVRHSTERSPRLPLLGERRRRRAGRVLSFAPTALKAPPPSVGGEGRQCSAGRVLVI